MNRRAVLWVVAAIVGINVIIVVVDQIAPGPSGRPSSSLATAPEGFAAWAALARANGIEAVALREDLGDAALPAGSTVVALDVPRLPRADARVLRDHAAAGGRVVVGGERPSRWLAVFDRDLDWEGSAPRDARSVADVPQTDGVAAVRTAGEGRWDGAGEAVAVAAGDAAVLVVRDGVALLADASPLRNQALASADNAALALALAGDGPLLFAESLHGYGESTGLAALPGAAKGALLVLLLAALLQMAARGRRFGPPEPVARDLAPPRAAYVDALGATLARTGDPEAAMAPVRAALGDTDFDPVRDHDGAVELARRLQDTREGHR